MTIITRLVECENGNHAAEYRHIQERTMPTTPEHQRNMIRNRLLCRQWIDLAELERASGARSVAARIHELRTVDGLSIDERNNGNEYRLAPEWAQVGKSSELGNPPSPGVTGSCDPASGREDLFGAD